MVLLLLFAFLSGLVTIVSPCIWPILPIILSAGVSGGERKPLGVVVGLMVSFTLFTLALSYILRVVPIDPDTLRLFAVIMIAFLGLVLVVPPLGRVLEGYVSRLSGFGGRFGGGNGFTGGFLTGFFLGIVWSPCAGPILATVATLAATQALNLSVILITVAFVLGVGVPLFIFAVLGQRILSRTKALSPYTGRIQQGFGVVMILAALAIHTGYDQKLQLQFAEFCSENGVTFLGRLENNPAVAGALNELRNPGGKDTILGNAKKTAGDVAAGLEDFGPAPEFVGIMNWLNIDRPLTLKELKGKVVLIDFWTYSCINCIRTFPYVTGWYEKYKDQGFVVVGVHTPEFAFEKKTANVADAMERYGITYPVAQDNDFATWKAYENRYWPAHYLIDAEGHIRYVHFGEGEYDKTEKAIQRLLEEAGQTVAEGTLERPVDGPGRNQTPETYLGSERIARFASPEQVTGSLQDFTAPATIPTDSFAYSGQWTVEPERGVAGNGASLTLQFRGRKVFLVMSPSAAADASRVRVLVDGKLVSPQKAGKDVRDGSVTVDADRLYELIDLQGQVGNHTLKLEFETPGTGAYAFTFS